ncbi:MAG: peptide chain release factor N(5)-glutamine methyltransferase [Candidatus Saganbacteria bacterium]|nr:peptide chain release factor N(5)-glutamine methyltransferase [Candidatus Saganbacteria bacterium]
MINTELLLAFALGIPREKLLTYDKPISTKQLKKFNALVARWLEHEPIAYLLGTQPFLGLDLEVNRSVLIPRPETELLVENLLRKITEHSARNTEHRILDIGTGSGCIAIALAKDLPNAQVYAVDFSVKALRVAKKNAKKYELSKRIKFLRSNLFQKLKGLKFDLIVSNPPYIPSKVIPKLDKNVKDYEPIKALDGGNDGLDIIRKIIQQAPGYLAPNGILALEIGFGQAKAVQKLATKAGFKNTQIIKDWAGIDRIVVIRSLQAGQASS